MFPDTSHNDIGGVSVAMICSIVSGTLGDVSHVEDPEDQRVMGLMPHSQLIAKLWYLQCFALEIPKFCNKLSTYY